MGSLATRGEASSSRFINLLWLFGDERREIMYVKDSLLYNLRRKTFLYSIDLKKKRTVCTVV